MSCSARSAWLPFYRLHTSCCRSLITGNQSQAIDHTP
jgi:hypothetical protein